MFESKDDNTSIHSFISSVRKKERKKSFATGLSDPGVLGSEDK